MFKKIGVITALTGTFLFSSAFQSPAHAQSCNHHQDQYNLKSAHFHQLKHYLYSHKGSGFHHFYRIIIKQQSPAAQNGTEQTTTNQPKQSQTNAGQTSSAQPKQSQSNNGQTTSTQPKQSQSNSGQKTTTQSNSGQSQSKQQGSYQLSQYEQQVVQLTNKQRTSHGLKPLKVDLNLSQMSRDKSQDMANNHYFSHTSPTYGSPFNMMKQYGISYSYAGENIAEGQRTPQEVVNAWMNSPEHRANILNSHYTHIGVGYVANGNIWTQDFIG